MKKQLRGYENQTRVVLASKVEGMRLCVDCGEVHHEDDMKEFDGEYVCEDCLENEDVYFQCRECEEYFKKDDDDYRYDECNENYVCEHCYDNEGMITCEDCNEIVGGYDYTCVNSGTRDEKCVCDDCLDEYYKCDECGDYFSEERTRYSNDNVHICDNCSDNYTTCDECGEILEYDNAYCDDDCTYCEDCYNERQEDDNNIEGLKNYSFKPRPKFNNEDEEEEEGVLYLGVENEVDNGNNRRGAIEVVNWELEHVYCKSDGSLGSNGFEMTSFPMDLDHHIDLKNSYTSVFNTLVKEYGYRSDQTSTCGLHVHCNRTFFGDDEDIQDLHIAKVILLMDNLWDKGLVGFTRRREEELNRWAKKFNGVNEDEIEQEEEEEIVKKCTRGSDRYKAINIQNEHTFEFRLFKGSLNIETFIATLQFVSNVCNLVKEIKLKDTNKVTMKDIFEYKEYNELNNYAKRRGLL